MENAQHWKLIEPTVLCILTLAKSMGTVSNSHVYEWL